jgi:hypothetical protein
MFSFGADHEAGDVVQEHNWDAPEQLALVTIRCKDNRSGTYC